MAISCGSFKEFLRWKNDKGRGLCTLKDMSTTADHNYAKKCELNFLKKVNIKSNVKKNFNFFK